MKPYTLIIVSLLAVIDANAQQPQSFRLVQDGAKGNMLVLTHEGRESRWPLPYPVYGFAEADVAGDSLTECIVGVVKPTRYDTVPRRRLFIFHQVEGHIRPLWMGSRLGVPIDSFRCERQRRSILVYTHKPDGTTARAEYRYGDFGLQFHRWLTQGEER